MELIHAMLQRDAGSRISAEEALQHPWFAKHGVGEQRCNVAVANDCIWRSGLSTLAGGVICM